MTVSFFVKIYYFHVKCLLFKIYKCLFKKKIIFKRLKRSNLEISTLEIWRKAFLYYSIYLKKFFIYTKYSKY